MQDWCENNMKLTGFSKLNMFSLLLLCFFMLTGNAFAYIDPGSLGTAYQFGYLIFYSVMGVLVFFFRPIKNLFVFLFNAITGKKNKETEASEENIGEEKA